VGSQGTPPVGAAALPQVPGVYRFRDRAGRALYIGRAVGLRRRVLSYWGDLGDRAHLAPMVARIARVEAVTCDSAHEAAWLERNLLEHRRPPWNRTPGGQEAEVWIRLSASPRRPGLTVVRQPVPGDFGPYLGGQKVRDAVSGLGRVLPLGYTGTPGREPNVTWPGCVAPRLRRGPGWPGPLPRYWTGTRLRWPRCAPS
jgi:excinuclease ABC subunit C